MDLDSFIVFSDGRTTNTFQSISLYKKIFHSCLYLAIMHSKYSFKDNSTQLKTNKTKTFIQKKDYCIWIRQQTMNLRESSYKLCVINISCSDRPFWKYKNIYLKYDCFNFVLHHLIPIFLAHKRRSTCKTANICFSENYSRTMLYIEWYGCWNIV